MSGAAGPSSASKRWSLTVMLRLYARPMHRICASWATRSGGRADERCCAPRLVAVSTQRRRASFKTTTPLDSADARGQRNRVDIRPVVEYEGAGATLALL